MASSSISSSTAEIQTPHGVKKIHVCKDGNTDNEEWIDIYEVSFPPSQRQDLDDLRRQLKAGTMELDETRDEEGDIFCMTITEVFGAQPDSNDPSFLLACYTAVVPELRGLGIGTVHRRKLVELLEQEYSSFIGNFSEIESTKEKGLDEATMTTRVRRKNFFLKLGLQPIDINYLFPSYTESGEHLQGELLWVPFTDEPLTKDIIADVLKRIYTEGYGLKPNDPFISRMLAQL